MIVFQVGAIITAVYVLAAVLPAALLMRYIYRQDRVEREPPLLLASLVGCGILSALASIVLEGIAGKLLNVLVSDRGKVYTVLLAFLVVGAVEEGTKLLLLKWRTWKHPQFNYRFDGVVYAVFVSLGFAAYENIQYVLSFGLSVALPRALLAVPAHMGFAVFMGAFYGRARQCESWGDDVGQKINLWVGYLLAVFLHGFYDACAMIGSRLSTLLFVVFVIAMYVIVTRLIRREARTDHPV